MTDKKIRKFSHILAWSLLSLLLLGIAVYYWYRLTYYPSTDDAYLQAHIVNVAPEISGRVSQVFVKDNQHVEKGKPLFIIDPAPFQIALDKAQADLDLTLLQLKAAQDAVNAAQAMVAQAQAQLHVDQRNAKRIASLVKQGRASIAEGDTATAKLEIAKANLSASKSNLQQAIQKLGASGDDNAQLRAARAALAQARLNLSYTHVPAPASGQLSQFKLRKGDMVSQGQAIFALIEKQQWWVEANYKETDLKRIKLGQTAQITVDIYPKHVFHGRIESISGGTGSAFSLLPAENATGNWVKVTQRIPVKIIIDDPDPHYPLRVGASTSVTIDTKVTT